MSDLALDKNIPAKIVEIINGSKQYTKEQRAEILANATYFKGVSSSGDLNRNGYIIRSKAWKPAIEAYLSENPVILLQHNMENVIGHTLTARVSVDKLITEGIIFADQMPEASAKAFERGQLKALSTGHYSKEVEWENQDTGQILNDEQFRELPWEDRIKDFWVMAVTALEWIEQSLVGIGSNRESMITLKDAKMNYFQNTFGEDVTKMAKNDVEDIVEPTDEDIAKEEKIELEPESPDSEEDNEVEVVEEPAEVVEEPTIKPTPEDGEKVEEGELEEEVELTEEEKAAEETPVEPTVEEVIEPATEEKKPDKVETPAEPETEKVEEEGKTGEEVETEKVETETVKDLLQEGADTIKENLAVEEKEEVVEPEKETPETLSIRCDENLMADLEKNGLTEVKDFIAGLVEMNKAQVVKIDELLTIIDSVPKIKGLSIASQFAKKDVEATKNDLGTDGSSIVGAFEKAGLAGRLRS